MSTTDHATPSSASSTPTKASRSKRSRQEERNQKILLQLAQGDLDLAAIHQLLRLHQVRIPTGLHKEAWSELVRSTLEATLSVDALLELRSQELTLIQQGQMRRSLMDARLGTDTVNDQHEYLPTAALLSDKLQQEIHVLQAKKKSLGEDQNIKAYGMAAHEAASPATLTPAQRERIEAHRKRALELQQERSAKKPRAVLSPGRESRRPNTITAFMTPTKAKPVASTMATTPLKTTPAAITPSTGNTAKSMPRPPPSKSPFQSPLKKTPSVVSPVAVVNPYAKNQNQMDTPWPHNPVVCVRCGEKMPGSHPAKDPNLGSHLCIVWTHSGELQREQPGPSRWHDTFRWSCCGRLDPQPCFVGRHTTTRSPVDTSSPVVIKCLCGQPAHLKRTRKVGSPNRGRYFFRCNSASVTGSGGGHHGAVTHAEPCKFFAWADVVLRLPRKEIPKVAPDGVREWECLFANPYRESYINLCSENSQYTRLERLVAALCFQEMCVGVHTMKRSTDCSTDSETLVQSILHLVSKPKDERKETILRRLLPLTPEQVSGRFGSLDDALEGLTKEEIQRTVMSFLTKSPWIQTFGITTIPSVQSQDTASGPVSGDDITEPIHGDAIVNLAGLAAYLKGA